MKAFATFTLFTLVSAALAQDEAPRPALKPGDDVKPDAIIAADWIQGSAPEAWEEDKVYVIECWATWCGPCIAAIPHLNGLHGKYSEKGLRVVGMNVWEEGREKVATFVKQQAGKMSYPVAYTGPDSAFERDWLKAAAVRGIPNAFVVKNGKLLFATHPMQLKDGVIEGLLAGGKTGEETVAGILGKKETDTRTSSLLNAFREAKRAGDHEAMTAAIEDLKKLDPGASFLTQMKLDRAVASEDWEGAGALIDEIANTPGADQILGSLAFLCDRNPESMPDEVKKTIAARLADAVNGSEVNATLLVVLSRLQWTTGDKDAALATAKSAAANPGDLPPEPFKRFQESVEAGEPAAASKVFGWLREKMMGQQKR